MNPKLVFLILIIAMLVSSGSFVTNRQVSDEVSSSSSETTRQAPTGGGTVLNLASIDPAARSTYALPENNFVTFSIEGQEGVFTGMINQNKLLQDARFALCCMGRIPPVNVTFWNGGYKSGFVQVGGAGFATNPRLVTKKSVTLSGVDYEYKRAELLAARNVYILDEETFGDTDYFFVTLSNKDFPNEKRFYSKLSDMKRKLYKGTNTDYYFEDFEQSEYVDANDDGLFELKIHYFDFPNQLSRDQIFTQEDSKRIFGRKFVLKRGIFSSWEYVITWYEF